MQKEKIVVGIDVSKHALDYICLPHGKASKVTNTPQGIGDLIKELQILMPQIVVIEATGGYQDAVAQALFEADIPCSIVNPRLVRDFARSFNRLGKTDALDAMTLAEFGRSRELQPFIPKEPKRQELDQLLQRREQLVQMSCLERNHLEHTSDEVRGELLEHMEILALRIKSLDKRIKRVVESDERLRSHDRIIQSVPGLGPVSSATILGNLPEITILGRKQVCALVGLAPFNRDSGNYRGQRHIYGGRTHIRGVLYSAFRACLQFNPIIRHWFDHFRAQGKAYKVAVIACIRKLLVVLRAMLISETTWSPEYHLVGQASNEVFSSHEA